MSALVDDGGVRGTRTAVLEPELSEFIAHAWEVQRRLVAEELARRERELMESLQRVRFIGLLTPTASPDYDYFSYQLPEWLQAVDRQARAHPAYRRALTPWGC